MEKASNEYSLAQAKLQALVGSLILSKLSPRPNSIFIDDETLRASISLPENISESCLLLYDLFLDLFFQNISPSFHP